MKTMPPSRCRDAPICRSNTSCTSISVRLYDRPSNKCAQPSTNREYESPPHGAVATKLNGSLRIAFGVRPDAEALGLPLHVVPFVVY